jgi:hypothetical protein
MQVANKQPQSRWGTLALSGGFFGIVSGPIAMLATMVLENYLHGTTFLGLELVGAPIIGSILGTLEGLAVGVVWNLVVKRTRRLTIARLMLVVAISGPSLAFFVAAPLIALLALINGMLLLPVWIVVLGRRREEPPPHRGV